MNNNQLNDLIKGLGMMCELWIITYQNFKAQKLSEEEAMKHTAAFMSIMIESFKGNAGEGVT